MTAQDVPDENKKKKQILAAAFFGLAVAVLCYSYWPEKKFSLSKALFTDDDGKTWYEDNIDNIPPYMHNGKEAVRINVYKTEKSAPFAGYLSKFPPEMKAQIEEQAKRKSPPTPPHEIAYSGETPNSLLVKPPGKGSWERIQSPAGVQNMTVKSPDGSELDSVVP